jgi:intron-binding protein aquarius
MFASICVLPLSQYLENYLWVNYNPEVSSNAYLMSICCIVNEKFRENVPAWEVRMGLSGLSNRNVHP